MEQRRRLARVDLVRGQQVDGRQQMDVVVPIVEAGEVSLGRRRVGEGSGIGGMRFDGCKVRFNPRIVVGGPRPAEQLPDSEFCEVVLGRVGTHLRPAVAEGRWPLRARLIQSAFVD